MLDDLVAERTSSEGQGNLNLAAGSGGVRRFSSVFGTGSTNKFLYHIRHSNAAEYEQGVGYMSDADTMVRNRILKSSNANTAVDFSAGDKDIVVDLPADAALVALGLARLVFNASGAAIPANKLVSIANFNGMEELSNIELASNTTDRRPADGFTKSQIENNAAGWILLAGEILGVDTFGNNDGDPVFLDNNGGFTINPPSSGIIQEIGTVIDSAASGRIHLRLTQKRERSFLADWASGRSYFAKELVIDASKIYRAKENHVSSSSFAMDAMRWDELSPTSSGVGTQISFFIETPEVKSYPLIGSNSVAWDVDSCIVKSSTGSGTADLEIDGTDVTGCAAMSISSTESSSTATAARSLTTGGERLALNITANSGLANLEVTITGTAT